MSASTAAEVDMGCGGTNGTGGNSIRATALSDTAEIRWITGWILCVGLDEVMAVLRATNAQTDQFKIQIVMQVAKVRTNNPEQPVTLDAEQTASSGVINFNTGTEDISATTDEAMYIRFGIAYRYTSGQSQTGADVELDIAYKQCGEISGGGTFDLATTTTNYQYQIISGMLPAILVDAVKVAVSCTGLSGNFQWQLAYRLASTVKEVPGSWNLLGAAHAGGDTNEGDITVTPGANMWVQFAIAYKSTSGDGQASLTVALGTRRS